MAASYRRGDWIGQERSSWGPFLYASWLLWHELPGLSHSPCHIGLKSLRPGVSCFCLVWSQRWDNNDLSSFWVLMCSFLPTITKVLSLILGAEIPCLRLSPLLHLDLSFRGTKCERDGVPDDPFCALLWPQWATLGASCSQPRSYPPVWLSR